MTKEIPEKPKAMTPKPTIKEAQSPEFKRNFYQIAKEIRESNYVDANLMNRKRE